MIILKPENGKFPDIEGPHRFNLVLESIFPDLITYMT
jgi:hypothetical protein